jgi:NAD(P)-dependent dehydrogenase (short-subunit alcohol dehydrogenase family)
MLLENRVAIVTGAATGIGRATAVLFAREGCKVGIVDINMKEADETLKQVEKAGGKGIVVECDISDSTKVHAMVEAVLKAFGKIDILVNNAGGGTGGGPKVPPGIANIPEEKWDRVIAINLKGAFLCCKEVIPHMQKQKYGRIINVSSLGWISPPTVSAHYHAAKAGLVGMTNDMVGELGAYNICANVLMPGPIKTPFYDPLMANMNEQQKDAFFNEVARTIPLQRIGMPEDVAGAALFLASELSSFISGVCLPVAGGLPLKPFAPWIK